MEGMKSKQNWNCGVEMRRCFNPTSPGRVRDVTLL